MIQRYSYPIYSTLLCGNGIIPVFLQWCIDDDDDDGISDW